MGTGYSIHISHSPSVKAVSLRLSHDPVFCQYAIRRDSRTRTVLVLSTQLR